MRRREPRPTPIDFAHTALEPEKFLMSKSVMPDTPDEFEEQLERYSQQHRQSVTPPLTERRRANGKLAKAGFATAAGSALAMAGGAEAAVILSGPQNIFVAIAPTSVNSSMTSIDIDGDGVDDLKFAIYASFQPPGSTPYGSYSPGFSSQRIFVEGSTDSNVLQASVALDNSYSGPRKFSAMGSVGSAENWVGSNNQGVFNQGQSVILASNMPSGNWSGTENNTIGFRLKKGSDVHYGWLRVELVDPTTPQGQIGFADGLSDQIQIVDWAYESTPNTPIPVPEPSGLAMLAAGATSLAAWRKRRAAAGGDDSSATE